MANKWLIDRWKVHLMGYKIPLLSCCRYGSSFV